MSVDQGRRLAGRSARPSPDAARERYDQATADLDPPLALVDLGAFDRNAADMTRRAALAGNGGHPVRVATKSLRCRFLIERALATPGYRGVMCYSLAEALWLHATGTSYDLLVAYPSVDRGALRALAADSQARQHVTIMTDSQAHLNVVDRALGDGHPEIRVCLDLDVSWRPLARQPAVHIGTRRSPLHTPEQAADFARAITRRPGFRLVGVMGYEGQIAGLGDAPPGHPVRARLIRLIQGRSMPELVRRRTEAIRRIQALTSLEFVNGGGTGSLESTARDTSVTELTAGSGLVGPTLFDAYRRFSPEPALLFALPVVRRPGPGLATLFSGGYVASGTGTQDRLPRPYLPAGLNLTGTEGAGEVQTPVRGPAAGQLRTGDRVWLRHAKAGELAERFRDYHVLHEDGQLSTVPTYRGEGQCFGLGPPNRHEYRAHAAPAPCRFSSWAAAGRREPGIGCSRCVRQPVSRSQPHGGAGGGCTWCGGAVDTERSYQSPSITLCPTVATPSPSLLVPSLQHRPALELHGRGSHAVGS